jgi:hypothetical protein
MPKGLYDLIGQFYSNAWMRQGLFQFSIFTVLMFSLCITLFVSMHIVISVLACARSTSEAYTDWLCSVLMGVQITEFVCGIQLMAAWCIH